MSFQQELIVFARAPQLGCVKKRLAREIGEQQALDFYTTTLTALLKRMRVGPWRLSIATTGVDSQSHPLFRDFHVFLQPEGDLGQRMVTVLDHFRGCRRILIGSDIPLVRPTHIQQAFNSLSNHDVVFGPACDGGFWLVGCREDFEAGRHPNNRFMKNVRWSTDQSLMDTRQSLPKGCRVATACTLADVDDGASYRKHVLASGGAAL